MFSLKAKPRRTVNGYAVLVILTTVVLVGAALTLMSEPRMLWIPVLLIWLLPWWKRRA